MIGLIHKILFDLVNSTAGPQALVEIKLAAGVDPKKDFRIDTSYSNDEWRRLFKATREILGLGLDEVYDAYAKRFLIDAIERFPTWFEMSANSKEFLQRQPTIHNCFGKGCNDPSERSVIEDKFRIETIENGIITHYKSPNKHCELYKRLAAEVINYYGDQASVEEKKCMLKGEDECEIQIVWKI